jgi:hypothetical protein
VKAVAGVDPALNGICHGSSLRILEHKRRGDDSPGVTILECKQTPCGLVPTA